MMAAFSVDQHGVSTITLAPPDVRLTIPAAVVQSTTPKRKLTAGRAPLAPKKPTKRRHVKNFRHPLVLADIRNHPIKLVIDLTEE